MVILQSGSSGIDSWNYPEHPILITINMGQALLISMFFQYKILISEPLVLFFYIDCLLGLKSNIKINIKIHIFPMFPLVSPFPFGPQTLQHQPPPLEGCMHKFHGKVLSFAKDQDPF